MRGGFGPLTGGTNSLVQIIRSEAGSRGTGLPELFGQQVATVAQTDPVLGHVSAVGHLSAIGNVMGVERGEGTGRIGLTITASHTTTPTAVAVAGEHSNPEHGSDLLLAVHGAPGERSESTGVWTPTAHRGFVITRCNR